jgi:hypothetical protein
MNNTPPKFNFRDTSKWRSVDLWTTMKIAHMCSSGVDFGGSSKSAIIEGIARPHGYTSRADKFVKLMDVAAEIIPNLKSKYQSDLMDKIRKVSDEFTGETKKEAKGDASE